MKWNGTSECLRAGKRLVVALSRLVRGKAGRMAARQCLEPDTWPARGQATDQSTREKMMELRHIGNIGERLVEEYLAAKGYLCHRNTRSPGSSDIEAVARSATLLVQVKTAIYPEQPADLTSEETQNLKARAEKSGAEAWGTKVTINATGQLVGKIAWVDLREIR